MTGRYVDRGMVCTRKLRAFLYDNPAYMNMLRFLMRIDPILWAQVKDVKARFKVDEDRWSDFTDMIGKRYGNGMVDIRRMRDTSFIRVSPEPYLREILSKVIQGAQK